MRTLDKLTGVRFLLAVIAAALVVIALRPWLASTPALAAQPASGRFDVTALGIYDVGSFLVLDNATGEIWCYEKFSGDGAHAGEVRLWGRMNRLGEAVKVGPNEGKRARPDLMPGAVSESR